MADSADSSGADSSGPDSSGDDTIGSLGQETIKLLRAIAAERLRTHDEPTDADLTADPATPVASTHLCTTQAVSFPFRRLAHREGLSTAYRWASRGQPIGALLVSAPTCFISRPPTSLASPPSDSPEEQVFRSWRPIIRISLPTWITTGSVSSRGGPGATCGGFTDAAGRFTCRVRR